jgi:ABC-type multidrug transport system fused ATPase/permease subunit
MSAVAASAAPMRDKKMSGLVLDLVRPYWGWLLIVFIAMLIEIAMSLAAPWPLKLVLDDALGNHKLPEWLAWAHHDGFRRDSIGVALFAGLGTLVIAVIGAIATYIDNYYMTSVGQSVANDLRIDLSDEGILADFEKHGTKGADKLAIDMHRGKDT